MVWDVESAALVLEELVWLDAPTAPGFRDSTDLDIACRNGWRL
jgi:hypothetical protein